MGQLRIGLIGDLHGFPEPALEWISRTEPDFCLQAGDYWSYAVEWPVPVYWIFGNHEHGPTIRAIIDGSYEFHPNNRWLKGGVEIIDGVSVMALPGLPQARSGPGPAHYPPNVYEECMNHEGEDIDIFLSHGCGFEFGCMAHDANTHEVEYINFEEPPITDLIRFVRPLLAVSGHNHRFAKEEHEGIKCIRLGHRSNSMFHMIEVPPEGEGAEESYEEG